MGHALDQSISHLLHRANQVAAYRFTKAIGDSDLTPRQVAVLGIVAANEGVCQTGIVAVSGIDRSSMADIVRRLVKRRLLARRRSKLDTRAYNVTLTAEGRRMLTATAPILARVMLEARVFDMRRKYWRRCRSSAGPSCWPRWARSQQYLDPSRGGRSEAPLRRSYTARTVNTSSAAAVARSGGQRYAYSWGAPVRGMLASNIHILTDRTHPSPRAPSAIAVQFNQCSRQMHVSQISRCKALERFVQTIAWSTGAVWPWNASWPISTPKSRWNSVCSVAPLISESNWPSNLFR